LISSIFLTRYNEIPLLSYFFDRKAENVRQTGQRNFSFFAKNKKKHQNKTENTFFYKNVRFGFILMSSLAIICKKCYI
jgi:hypothetical protein